MQNTNNPISILEQAEKNHADGNYSDALTQYIWFFEKAVDIDEDCIGAKHVRCLQAWHDLSKVYPPAYNKLFEKKDYFFTQLKIHPKLDHYMSFIKICNYLDLIPEIINFFKYLHKNNPLFAKEIFSQTMPFLCKSKEFTLCEIYIDNPNKLYQEQLLLLDNLLNTDKKYYKYEFKNSYIETFF